MGKLLVFPKIFPKKPTTLPERPPIERPMFLYSLNANGIRLLAGNLDGRMVLFANGPEVLVSGDPQEGLAQALSAKGIHPPEIDAVVLSSLDIPMGEQVASPFPNARYLVSRDALERSPLSPAVNFLRQQGERLILIPDRSVKPLGNRVEFLFGPNETLHAKIMMSQGTIVFGGYALLLDEALMASLAGEGNVYLHLARDPKIAAARLVFEGGVYKETDLLPTIDWTPSVWPDGFIRVPDEGWVTKAIEQRALGYDDVKRHGWYSNLDPTVEELAAWLKEGHTLVDYSGGTGILTDRLFDRIGDRSAGVIIVDASEAFLRLALENLGNDDRSAFRHLPFLTGQKRLRLLDEVLEGRSVDGIVSANAVHLYPNLPETFASWRRSLKPGGRVFIQSGNIVNPTMPQDHWIIDGTVEAIHSKAIEIARREERFAAYRTAFDDASLMARYDDLRRKFFLPPRPLEEYQSDLEASGFTNVQVRGQAIAADVAQWHEFLRVYHDGIIPWVGGAKKVTGSDPSPEAIADRLALLELALKEVFAGQETFNAYWTYITCAI